MRIRPPPIERQASPSTLPVREAGRRERYFATLDRVLDGLERGPDAAHIAVTALATDAQVEAVREMARRSQHLRDLPPQPDLRSAV
jgi:hypothetical protein